MSKKILIIVGGGKKHLGPFAKEAEKMGVDLTLASFRDLEYLTNSKGISLRVKGNPVDSFGLIYIRLIGRRYEDAALLVNYAIDRGIKVVDAIYLESKFIRLPLAKSLEIKLLVEAGLPVPSTFFGSVLKILKKAPEIFGYPFVIKDTTGKQGHGVWSPRNQNELSKLAPILREKEKQGKRYLAQEFIKASQRERVFVVGDKALAAITRPTRWRKRFTQDEAVRHALVPVPGDSGELAVKAAKVLGINVAGVDVIREDETGKIYILEVNSAPRWEAIRKDTNINVEAAILEFLLSLI